MNYLLKPKPQYPLEDCNRIQRLASESIYELKNIYTFINCIKTPSKMPLNKWMERTMRKKKSTKDLRFSDQGVIWLTQPVLLKILQKCWRIWRESKTLCCWRTSSPLMMGGIERTTPLLSQITGYRGLFSMMCK